MTSDDDKINAWGAEHGLKWHGWNPGPHNFEYLVELGLKERAHRVGLDMDSGDMFDHPRPFVKRMPAAAKTPRYWAIITNPYDNAMLSKHGDNEARDRAIIEVAEQLDLRVRIGYPRDTTYWAPGATTPILWYNPKRFDPLKARR